MISRDQTELDRIVRQGTEAWVRLKTDKSWTDWLAVGEALQIGREIAMRAAGTNQPSGRGYNGEFSKWLDDAKLTDMHATERSDLYAVMENLSGIEAWRQTLTRHERLSLNHPRSVLRKWKARMKAKAIPAEDKPASAFEKLKRANVELQEELHRLKKHGDGNLFAKGDTAKSIATAIIGTFDGSPNKLTKVEGVAREMLAWAKAQKKGTA